MGGMEAGRGERGDRAATLLGSTAIHLGLQQQRGVPLRKRALCCGRQHRKEGSPSPSSLDEACSPLSNKTDNKVVPNQSLGCIPKGQQAQCVHCLFCPRDQVAPGRKCLCELETWEDSVLMKKAWHQT